MSNSSILILDDDERWVALHERRLRGAGLECRSTLSAHEAIKIIKADKSIKFALIDEILYVPPIPPDESKRELQRWQGHDVVREINRYRPDVQTFVVTSAPMIRSHGDPLTLINESTKLSRQKGVVDIIYKEMIDTAPDGEYGWLVDHILRAPHISAAMRSELPRVLVALGFDKEIYEGMEKQRSDLRENEIQDSDTEFRSAKREWLPVKPFISTSTGPSAHLLESFAKGVEKNAIVIEAPASKRINFGMSIKTDSSAFKILWLLATKAETGRKVVIGESDYNYQPRTREVQKSKRKLNTIELETEDENLSNFEQELSRVERRVQTSPALDAISSYSETGKRALDGFQIQPSHLTKESPLKVAIHRLSRQLANLNVGPSRSLFLTDTQGTYRPAFKINIGLFRADRLKNPKR